MEKQEVKSLLYLANQEIPKEDDWEHSFLDIIGQPTKETTICNVYRHFLDPATSPDLSGVMIESLVEQIAKQRPDFYPLNLETFEVFQERKTNKGRLDFLIKSEGNWALLIEVKVYHHLHNDLEDYWSSLEKDNPNKLGIVLSIGPMETGHEAFINIRHTDWLENALQKLPENQNLTRKHNYLKDFAEHINRLSNYNKMTESILFYLEHPTKINDAIKTQKSAYDFIIQQLTEVASHFEGWELYGCSYKWRNIWDKKNKHTIYLTVFPEEIANSHGKYTIIIEAYDKALKFTKELNDRIPEEFKKEGHSTINYAHLASKTYEIELSKYSSLGEHIAKNIEEDFKPLMEDLLSFLDLEGAKHNVG